MDTNIYRYLLYLRVVCTFLLLTVVALVWIINPSFMINVGASFAAAIIWAVVLFLHRITKFAKPPQILVGERLDDFAEQTRNLILGEKEIKIDICGYSTDTLQIFFDSLISGLPKHEFANCKSISLRVLLKNENEAEWHFIPCNSADKSSNSAYNLRNLFRYDGIIDRWQNITFPRLVDLSPANCDCRLVIKAHSFDPCFKGFMVNDKFGVLGFYPIQKIERTVEGEHLNIWDYIGRESKLIKVEQSGGPIEIALQESFQAWFKTIWESFSELRVELP
jgi:hypothetical protein